MTSEQSNHRGFFSHIFYALIFAIIFFIVIKIKINDFQVNELRFVFGYTIFITLFMLSRISGSFLYMNYKEKMSMKHKIKLSEGYEPSVTFIIPCKNEEKVIYHTIKKCLESDYPTNKKEVIAINDGSDDNTLNEMLRFKRENPSLNLRIVNLSVPRAQSI